MPLATVDFVSPPDVIAITTAFFGGEIELDPASSHSANTMVCAKKYFTHSDNGLKQNWKAKNIYLYPPRDFLDSFEQPPDPWLYNRRRRFQKSAQRIWLEETYRKYLRQEFNEGIVFLTSSEVALITTQKIGLDLPLCILKEHPDLYLDTPDLDKLPRTRCHGFIYYFPDSNNTEERLSDFCSLYSELGRVFV
jgi:hypothetical protein